MKCWLAAQQGVTQPICAFVIRGQGSQHVNDYTARGSARQLPLFGCLQVGWTTVFFWEYFGPLLTYSFIYFFPQFVYFGYRCANLHQVSSGHVDQQYVPPRMKATARRTFHNLACSAVTFVDTRDAVRSQRRVSCSRQLCAIGASIT